MSRTTAANGDDCSTWSPSSPSIRVSILGTTGVTGRVGIQGYRLDSTSPNDDSLTVWLEWMDAPADVPAGTHMTISVEITAATVPDDFDGNQVVDLTDYGYFQACLSGPTIPLTAPACLAPYADADLDGDGNVDQDDFGIFQRCYSGSGRLADPACGG